MKELNLYGSSRLGQIKDTALVYDNAEITPHFPDSIFNHTMGIRNYEVSNHLGNVLAVVSDRKTPIESITTPGTIDHYEPYARFRGDYYPYGMLMPERTLVEHCWDTIEYDTTYNHNHNFNSSTHGWIGWGGVCPVNTNAGRLVLDKCQSYSVYFVNYYDRVDGVTYNYELDFEEGNCNNNVRLYIVTGGSTEIVYLNSDGHYSGSFVGSGTATNQFVYFGMFGSTTCDAYVDNFKLYQASDTAYQICEVGSPSDSTLKSINCYETQDSAKVWIHDQEFSSGVEGWICRSQCPGIGQTNDSLTIEHTSSTSIYSNQNSLLNPIPYNDKLYYEIDIDFGTCSGTLDSMRLSMYLNCTSEERIFYSSGKYTGILNIGSSGGFCLNLIDLYMYGNTNCTAYVKSFKLYYYDEPYDTTVCDSIYEKFGQSAHRYLFNSMENDPEVSGLGNSYTTEFRQYDPRLGRWKSLDPLMMKFPDQSPYNGFGNNPIFFVDPYGLAPTNGDEGGEDGGGDKAAEAEAKTDATQNGSVSDGDVYVDKTGRVFQYEGGGWIEQEPKSLDLNDVVSHDESTIPFKDNNYEIRPDYWPLFVIGQGFGMYGIYEEFKHGIGPQNSVFLEDHKATSDMANEYNEIKKLRNLVYEKFDGDENAVREEAFKRGGMIYSQYKAYDGTFYPWMEGRNTAQFIGTFSADVFYSDGKLIFVVTDSKSLKSLVYGIATDNIERGNDKRKRYSNTYQKYVWEEDFDATTYQLAKKIFNFLNK